MTKTSSRILPIVCLKRKVSGSSWKVFQTTFLKFISRRYIACTKKHKDGFRILTLLALVKLPKNSLPKKIFDIKFLGLLKIRVEPHKSRSQHSRATAVKGLVTPKQTTNRFHAVWNAVKNIFKTATVEVNIPRTTEVAKCSQSS